MNDLNTMSIADITKYVHSTEGQEGIANFIGWLREQAKDHETCEALFKKADAAIDGFGPTSWKKLIDQFERFINETPPGHDQGHIYRDILGALALANDPFVLKAAYKADVLAGLIGGSFHDLGNAVTHRYEDKLRKVGHGEIGAWLFYEIAEIDDSLRTLAAYAIAAHVHYLDPFPAKDVPNFTRETYPYDLWDTKTSPKGFFVLLARFCDRLDTNGSTLWARHILANADAVESGIEAIDLTGDKFYEIKGKDMGITLLPKVRMSPEGTPTAIEHTLNFASSNFGATEYSKYDKLFPRMTWLMRKKVAQAYGLWNAVEENPYDTFPADDIGQYPLMPAADLLALLKQTLFQISGSKNFERAWPVVERAWSELSLTDQDHWVKGLRYVQAAYAEWIRWIYGFALESDVELAKYLYAKVQ